MSEILIVRTNSGPVRGRKRQGINDTMFYSFQQIPYAKPPVGELRFKAPQAHDPWISVRDCTKPGPIACQAPELFFGDAIEFLQPKSEDCLHLDVYKKVLPESTNRKLPVLVMFHGGGFTFGSCGEEQNSPQFLLEHDILYISVNYRLGALGFLSLPDCEYDIPGNAGLKDQSLALRWVSENCEHFGGDSNNITIMGISAGAGAVHYHLISNHSKDLFHRAIIQSGSALCPWAIQQNNSELNERLARALGWNGNGGRAAMIKSIIQAPAQQIVDAQQEIITLQDHQNSIVVLFVPIVEPYDNGTIFVDRDVSTMNRTAWSHESIPLLLGSTAGEGYIFYRGVVAFSGMIEDLSYFDTVLPHGLKDKTKRRHYADALRELYYGDETPSAANLDKFVHLLSDKQFWHGVHGIVSARVANAGSAPTYMYRFDYSSEVLTMIQMLFACKHVEHAVHAEDMLYHFYYPKLHDKLPEDSVEVRLRKIYNTLCTSFAATGKPTHPETEALNWKAVSKTDPYKCLNISKQLSVIDLPNTKQLQFWNKLHDIAKQTSE